VELLIPKTSELIPALISFLIILFISWKFVWPPITTMLDERATTIHDSLARAEAAKIEAERLLEEYKQTMAEARKEAGTILQQAKQAAETTRTEAQAKAQAEYDAMIAKAREAIQGEKQAAIADLQKSVADISIAVAGKLIAGELDREDQLKVIEKYVSEAGSLNAN
jgi:F-type H+-transporting ATPase subunit b